MGELIARIRRAMQHTFSQILHMAYRCSVNLVLDTVQQNLLQTHCHFGFTCSLGAGNCPLSEHYSI